MNGIHDLGGMQGFGSIERDVDEPVFHARWEAAVLAMQRATRLQGLLNLDEFRHGVERMEPGRYLASTYYERWLDSLGRLLVEKGIVSEAELADRVAFFQARGDVPASAALRGSSAPARPVNLEARPDVARDPTGTPRFGPGDPVVTRNVHSPGHTRLPRYARGKRGVIHAMHGTHVFPDTHAHGLGEAPQPLYSVRFDARELWGEAAEPNQVVHLDLWESYLVPDRAPG